MTLFYLENGRECTISSASNVRSKLVSTDGREMPNIEEEIRDATDELSLKFNALT